MADSGNLRILILVEEAQVPGSPILALFVPEGSERAIFIDGSFSGFSVSPPRIHEMLELLCGIVVVPVVDVRVSITNPVVCIHVFPVCKEPVYVTVVEKEDRIKTCLAL